MGQEVGAGAASGKGVGAEAPSGQGTSGQGSQIQGAEIQAKDSQSNEAQQNVDVEPHLSSSLNDWLQQSFPSMQDLRVLFPNLHYLFICISCLPLALHYLLYPVASVYFVCCIPHSDVLQPCYVFASYVV